MRYVGDVVDAAIDFLAAAAFFFLAIQAHGFWIPALAIISGVLIYIGISQLKKRDLKIRSDEMLKEMIRSNEYTLGKVEKRNDR